VFLDAFVLRTMLVPSLMHLFGRSNWYFPRWLSRVTPHVSVESANSPRPGSPDDRPGGGERELART
jgi:RND superfamily putative drug exporter